MEEKEYRIKWTIEVYAESVEEAAQKAMAMQQDPGSICHSYEVETIDEPDKGIEEVDLDEDTDAVERDRKSLQLLIDAEVKAEIEKDVVRIKDWEGKDIVEIDLNGPSPFNDEGVVSGTESFKFRVIDRNTVYVFNTIDSGSKTNEDFEYVLPIKEV